MAKERFSVKVTYPASTWSESHVVAAYDGDNLATALVEVASAIESGYKVKLTARKSQTQVN